MTGKGSLFLAVVLCTGVMSGVAGCEAASPTFSGGNRPDAAAASTFTVAQTSTGQLAYVGRSIDWTGVNFPQYWEVDLDRGTAYYRYFSAVDRSKQWEYWFNWRPLPLTMGGGFQFTYSCSIRFVGDQVTGPLLVELGVNLGQLHSIPPAASASATSVNRALVADQKMIVLTPMSGQPVGTRATIQLQPHLGPRIVYTYEYR